MSFFVFETRDILFYTLGGRFLMLRKRKGPNAGRGAGPVARSRALFYEAVRPAIRASAAVPVF